MELNEKTTLGERGVESRCISCYSEEVIGVCSTCGGSICRQCKTKFKPFVARVANVDGKYLHGNALFCKEHCLTTISIATIASVLLMILVLALLPILEGGILLLIWIPLLLFIIRDYLDSWIFSKILNKKNGFRPLSPNYKVVIREKLFLKLILSKNQHSYSAVQSFQGNCRISLKPDMDEIKAIKKREMKTLYAGFIRFSNYNNINIISPEIGRIAPNDPKLPLKGILSDNHDNFQFGFSEIGFKLDYKLNKRSKEHDDGTRKLPFMILPHNDDALQNSRRWGIRLVITDKSVISATIISLEVHVPPELEGVTQTNGIYQNENKLICWENLSVTMEKPKALFADFIHSIQRSDKLTCIFKFKLEEYAFSGLNIQSKGIYGPSGYPVKDKKVDTRKTTFVEGTISVASELFPKNKEIIRKKSRAFKNYQLTSYLPKRVIDEIAKNNIYVKTVIEAPESRSMRQIAPMINRYWEIIGRQYVNFQPYDIHIILKGEQLIQNIPIDEQPELSVDVITRRMPESLFSKEENLEVEGITTNIIETITNIIESNKEYVKI